MRYLMLVLMMAVSVVAFTRQVTATDMVAAKGKQISFDYTLTVDGVVVDTSSGKKPLEYTQGDGKLIPGLTKQIDGMKVGEEKTIVVPPEEGYGKVNPAGIQEMPKSNLPADMQLKVGMMLQAKDTNGRIVAMRVVELKKDTVVMDFNHPLAGKSLTFQVKVLSIK